MLADVAVSVVFFYEHALDEDRLAKGLAAALGHVPVFGGRLRAHDADLEIVCGDEGVPMTVVEADETLPEAIARATLPHSGLVDHLDAAAARQGTDPLLTVRVSRLADGGTALGCSWHHAVGDMGSFITLMRAWTASVEGQAPPDVPLVEDRDAYLDQALPPGDCGQPCFRLADAEEAAALRVEAVNAARANRIVQVHFTAAETARLRDRLSEAAGRRLSSNDALTAHLVGVMRRLEGDEETRGLNYPVNVRRRLGLPDALVGNLLCDLNFSVAPDTAPELVAARIRAGIEDDAGLHAALRANRAFLAAHARPESGACVSLGFDPRDRTAAVSNWSGFGIFDLAFDGHRPVSATPTTNMPLPRIVWMLEGFGGSGRLAVVCAPGALAARLRGAAGAAALHPDREPADEVPPLAAAVRKLA
jgi:hypothetical protein